MRLINHRAYTIDRTKLPIHVGVINIRARGCGTARRGAEVVVGWYTRRKLNYSGSGVGNQLYRW